VISTGGGGTFFCAPAPKARLKDSENNTAPNVRLIFPTHSAQLAELRLTPVQWIILRFTGGSIRFLWFIVCLGKPAYH
jgi:hypothetical protein